MKNRFKAILLVLVLGLVFVLVGCKEPDPTPTEPTVPTEPTAPVVEDFNALGNWQDGGDNVYTITTNTADRLEFSYNKGTFPNAFLRSAVITEDLSVYKKLVITVEGTGSMLLKLETNDSTPAKEVGLNVTGIQGTYEWNLLNAGAFLEKVERIVIIAAPGKEASIGQINITDLYFGVDVAEGFIINDNFNNIPSNVNEYNGTDEIFNFNSKWESNDEGIYQITYQGTDAIVDYDKGSGLEWAFMRTRVQGNFNDFNYAVFVVTGSANHKLLIKPNEYNSIESFIWLDGSRQELVIDLRDLTLVEKNAITDFKVFIAAGLAPAAGELIIHEAFMIDDYEFEEPEILVNEYNGTDKSFTLNHYYDGGDLVYDIVQDGTAYDVTYSKLTSNLHWAFMYANLEGDFSGFSKVEFEMTGQENKTILLKVESPVGNKEVQVTFDGTKQTFVFDLTTMTQAQLEQLNKVVLFAAPGGVGSGEFTIHSITFKTSEVSVNENWISLDEGVYSFNVGETVLVTYNKMAGQEWSAMLTEFDTAKAEGLNTLTIVLSGTTGKSVLLKPNDIGALEQTVTFDNEDIVTVTFTQEVWTKMVIFGEPGVAPASGTFEIISMTLSYVQPEEPFDPMTNYNFNEAWVENDADTYDFTYNEDGSVTVTYDHTGWAFMKQVFPANDVSGYNAMTIIIRGTEGTKILVKPNDSGALEEWITLGTEPYVFRSFNETGFTQVLIFADPEANPSTGSFVIEAAYLNYAFDVNSNWVENDADTYDFTYETDGSVTVQYDHLGWAFMKQVFDAETTLGYNVLIMVLEGTEGSKVLVKPNDSGALEEWITFGTEPVTFVSYNPAGFTQLLIFADPESNPSTGTFKIISATLSYVEPEVEFDPTSSVDFNSAWVENDADTYDFTYEVDGSVTVTYDHTGWAFMRQIFDAEAVAGYNTMTLVLEGTEGAKLLVKPNDSGALEEWITFGTEPITFVSYNQAGFTQVLLFADPESNPASGTFKIVSAVLSYEANINLNWVENDADTYDFTYETDGSVTVAYDHSGWAFMKQVLDLEMAAGFNTLTIVFEGTEGAKILVKPNDSGALEEWITFGTEPYTFVSYFPSGFTQILIFAEPESNPATGTFNIVSAKLSYVAPIDDFDPTSTVDFNTNWIENDADTYDFTYVVDGSVTVAYDHLGWAFMKQVFDLEAVTGYNTMTLVLEGTEGSKVLVKPNDSGALEEWITFGTEPVTFVSYNPAGFTQLLIFADPESNPATGTFKIVSAVLSYQVDINSNWVENDADTYDFTYETDGSVTVDYNKTGWSFMKQTFDLEEVSGMNTMTITISGAEGTVILIKPNDSNLLEEMITLGTEPYVFEATSATGFMNVLIFVAPDQAATGTFVIESAILSYKE
ncbi:MAG: hypothetical protein CVV61_03510 [Tenericutes bacterium HGW-Tenericutes-6]|nr:MAG: hypothetical protein CVV61_03510 [Tenericutes bacterium HGW-Tenericutes-6]